MNRETHARRTNDSMLPESGVGAFPSTIATIDPNLKTSYSHQVSFGFDRQVWGQTTVTDIDLVHALRTSEGTFRKGDTS
jgi:hypothetical protein